MLRMFRIPLILTFLGLVLAFVLGGLPAALTVGILAILETSLSFDNAVVNARILGRMSRVWQQLFLTLGIAIAVFGMRLLFPLLIVALAGHVGMGDALNLALHQPDAYADILRTAHPAIAAFGGVFLLMLFLDFILAEQPVRWLSRLEKGFLWAARLNHLAIMVSLALLLAVAMVWGGSARESVLLAGLFGLLTYLAINGLVKVFESSSLVAAKAGLLSFIYLEILDASFSFDGVIGAFAITNQIFLIALGLGIGALYIRSLTVFLAHHGTLAKYVYLEHGAHYAIGALALLLLVSVHYEVPELVTGLASVAFITTSFFDSREYRRLHSEAGRIQL